MAKKKKDEPKKEGQTKKSPAAAEKSQKETKKKAAAKKDDGEKAVKKSSAKEMGKAAADRPAKGKEISQSKKEKAQKSSAKESSKAAADKPAKETGKSEGSTPADRPAKETGKAAADRPAKGKEISDEKIEKAKESSAKKPRGKTAAKKKTAEKPETKLSEKEKKPAPKTAATPKKVGKQLAQKPEPVGKRAARKSSSKKGKATEKKVGEATHATLFTDYDIHLFKEGKHYHLYKKLGSHPMTFGGEAGTYFAVWAPNAEMVSVIGDFKEWDRGRHRMQPRLDGSGIWEVFIPKVRQGALYKYFIRSHNQGFETEKGDPFAMRWETPPQTASVVWEMQNDWQDEKWLAQRRATAHQPQPLSIYEMHLGSWKRKPEEDDRMLTYRELAEQLPDYLNELGFTHVEFMPVAEHPFYGSWGYQITGYFAPSSRYGSPQDFMYLIDRLHQAGIGVILDWVPSHFPNDQHGLHYFDGTHLYEHSDPRQGYHPDWKSYIFNYGRNEVRSFLISNALFWLDAYHADGLRVDAVASMLYLDYSRKEGEWVPNEFGRRENLEAISFLKEFNEAVYAQFPDVYTIAEESTAWPSVSRPTYLGGLGFGMKWMMGWMHDTLEYFQKDPVHRGHHQNDITFSIYYAFTENFVLPLSHDEVVYGKGALLDKMTGDEWQRFANLRALYAYMFAHPGGKLLFMGGEFGQTSEWNHDQSLDWHLTEYPLHQGIQRELAALNQLYKTEKALYEQGFEEAGFEWIDINDSANSVISFLRKGKNENERVLVVCNFTPVPRENYRVGVPAGGPWREIFNSDAEDFGGSGTVHSEDISAAELPAHGRDFSLAMTLPPLGVVYWKNKN